jgi:hypothetical protein
VAAKASLLSAAHRVLAFPAIVGILVAVACTRHIARPPVEEVPIRDPDESEAKPAVSVASVVVDAGAKVVADKPEAASSSNGGPPTFALPTNDDAPDPPPARDKSLPKQADACKRDEDCAATNLALGGELTCCAVCKPTAGTKAWVKRVEQACVQKQKAGSRPRCAPSDCAKPDSECHAGKCVVI